MRILRSLNDVQVLSSPRRRGSHDAKRIPAFAGMTLVWFYVFLLVTTISACTSTPGTSADTVTAAIDASTGLTAFTYHGSTAYSADFGDAGLVLTAAESSTTVGTVASYSWEQISGPAVTITSDTTSETLTFTAPAIASILNASEQYRWQVLPIGRYDGELVFRVTVTNSEGATGVTTYSVYLFDNGTELGTRTGLQNVGVGVLTWIAGPKYLITPVTYAIVTLTDWAWTLTPPAGSAAVFTSSGTVNSAQQIDSFTPDVAGTYTLTYTSVSGAVNGTLTLNASTYVGSGTIGGDSPDSSIGQCGNCHATTTGEWEETGHSTMFEQVISYYASKAPQPYCWECHTVGYEGSETDNGFYARVVAAAYSFPSAGTTWSQFVADNPTLFPVANIQCENCHGPGAAHKGTITDSKIDFQTWNSGICGKCHPQAVEWNTAAHNSTGVVGTSGRYQTSWTGASCARCHSSGGFIQEAAGEEVTAQDSHDFLVTCQACHDPHSILADDPSGSTSVSGNDSTQLRLKGNITMKDDDATVVDAGKAAVCYACHDGYYEYGEVVCDASGTSTTSCVGCVACETIDQMATQYYRQMHGNPQSFILEGVGAVTDFTGDTYDFTLTQNSYHSTSLFTLRDGTGDQSLSNENNKCVTCHMGTAPEAEEEGYRLIGGHTWKMKDGTTEFLSACTGCHPSLTSFNRPARADYDGDGTKEGVQDEIKGLLLALTDKIKSIDTTHITGGTTETDGVITVASLSLGSSYTALNAVNIDVRRAIYNYNLIAKDGPTGGSLGVHNMAFAVQVLQNTYSTISQMNGGNSFTTDYPNAVLR